MSVGFGFSVGDFLVALDLVATVIDALRDSGQVSTEFRDLIRVLLSLETALIQIKRLELHESQRVEHLALKQAAAQCQNTINDFWKRAHKYQPHLASALPISSFRTAWMRVRWALCKRDDLSRFKYDIAAHTSSILVLLASIQLQTTQLQEDRQNEQRRTLKGLIVDQYNYMMTNFSKIQSSISSVVTQSQNLLDMMTQIIQTNIRVFAVIMDIQNLLRELPAQMQSHHQQPVFLIDAVGRYSPFFLEFIRSKEAFTGVLRANFVNFGQAALKIDRHEFAIQDAHTKCDIDLDGDWERCFYPGQRVDMNMIFPTGRKPEAKASPFCCSSHDEISDMRSKFSESALLSRRSNAPTMEFDEDPQQGSDRITENNHTAGQSMKDIVIGHGDENMLQAILPDLHESHTKHFRRTLDSSSALWATPKLATVNAKRPCLVDHGQYFAVMISRLGERRGTTTTGVAVVDVSCDINIIREGLVEELAHHVHPQKLAGRLLNSRESITIEGYVLLRWCPLTHPTLEYSTQLWVIPETLDVDFDFQLGKPWIHECEGKSDVDRWR